MIYAYKTSEHTPDSEQAGDIAQEITTVVNEAMALVAMDLGESALGTDIDFVVEVRRSSTGQLKIIAGVAPAPEGYDAGLVLVGLPNLRSREYGGND